MASIVGVVVFGVAALLMPSAKLALLFLAPTVCCLGVHVGQAPAAVNYITPNQLRGQAIAIYIFVVALMGMSLGPTTIAVITDYGFRDPQAVRYSMIFFTLIFSSLAFMLLSLGLKPYKDSLNRMQEK